jgi:ribosomal protein S2
VIPGNDDALRSIRLFTAGIAGAIMSGRGLADAAQADVPAQPRTAAAATTA